MERRPTMSFGAPHVAQSMRGAPPRRHGEEPPRPRPSDPLRSRTGGDVEEDHAETAESDLVAVAELAAALETDRLFVVEGAVRRAEIREGAATVLAFDLGVMGRGRPVPDRDVDRLTGL